jgi:hypothetical protein
MLNKVTANLVELWQVVKVSAIALIPILRKTFDLASRHLYSFPVCIFRSRKWIAVFLARFQTSAAK